MVKYYAELKDMSSGMWKSGVTIENVREFFNGIIGVKLKNRKGRVRKFVVERRIKTTSLKKGMIVAASYNRYNQGMDIYEFLGVTDDMSKYGEHPKKVFSSVRECLKFYNVKTLKQLEDLQSTTEYGKASYLLVKDLESGKSGPWFYLFKGRWSRGSGAEPLSFAKLIEIK